MEYIYQSKNDAFTFEEGVEILERKFKNKIIIGAINNNDPNCISDILNDLKVLGIPISKYEINPAEYLQYLNKAEYKIRYPEYYIDNFYEKTLKHFLCYSLIDLQAHDNFIDIASEHSPVAEIFNKLFDCNSYSQDIMYKSGIHANRIGSDASNIPVPDNFFNGAIATCSIEHFENDSDIQFMKEMERVLSPGSQIVIVPLYLYSKESCQTDPTYSVPENVKFDEDVEIYCAENWGNRHGRFYSPKSLFQRLIEPNKNMNFKVYLLDNPEQIDKSIYCRFILVGVKL
ncbi:class I SAM-dependent methyltransferase [Methanohalophilus sp. DAL1]|uniref:class I SAM-dependent methyltransferase n=1 Tax=Methanohalophilus sp. DAL1 TaxID=1864608 RepID=UPI000817FB2A|nr:methyltransferase domain-containing protein [Methanohalophilus sp. DAL1]OBZ34279.1 MAG: hypothetical protein A9957_04100 [Methanohalophilus sp. DAL1]